MKQLIAYKNTWETGEKIVLKLASGVTGISSSELYPDAATWRTVQTIKNKAWFQNVIYLCKSEAVANQVRTFLGCDAIVISSYTISSPLLLYYSNTDYIMIRMIGSAIDISYTTFSVTFNSNVSAVSFLNAPPDPTVQGYSTPRVWLNSIEQFRLNGIVPEMRSYLQTFDYTNPFINTDLFNDPYNTLDSSGTGGGTGTFSDIGDNIDVPSLPTLSAVDTGFITLFNPSIAELKALANYMWSGLFDIATFRKIFADPMDCILGLSIVPVAVPSGAAAEVKVGNIGTGINLTTAASQYVELDCGSLNIQEFWGAYLDYDPYTKFEIYLPYIGAHPLNADDIMGKTIHVVYHVDILSGACNAYLKCGGTVLYTFIGQCSSSIPITGNDWTNVINGVLSIAGAVGSMIATGGATAPMSAGTVASTAVNGFKSSVEKSGSMSGTGGMLAIQKPYLICTRPRQAVPMKQNEFLGYPAFITKKLGDISGYTEVEEIHLENLSATEAEAAEIIRLLKGGVII